MYKTVWVKYYAIHLITVFSRQPNAFIAIIQIIEI